MEPTKEITFMADQVHISGPRATDGSYTVKFHTGEYVINDIVELMRSTGIENAYKVTVEILNE